MPKNTSKPKSSKAVPKKSPKKSTSSAKAKPKTAKKAVPKKQASKAKPKNAARPVKKSVKKTSPAKAKSKSRPQKPSPKAKSKKQPQKASPKAAVAPQVLIALPEVETLKKDLEKEVSGRKIRSVQVLKSKAFAGKSNLTPFKSHLAGASIADIERYGLFLVLIFSVKDRLIINLDVGGQILLKSEKAEVHPNTVAILKLEGGQQVRFLDHSGKVKLYVSNIETLKQDLLKMKVAEGIDLLGNNQIPVQAFYAILSMQGNRKVKDALLDESFIAGIGDVYSDEILFTAGISSGRKVSQIGLPGAKRFYRAIVEILNDALKHKGTTVENGYFCDLRGNPGTYQNLLKVYGRDGLLSPRSPVLIEKKKYKDRWTYFCPKTQD